MPLLGERQRDDGVSCLYRDASRKPADRANAVLTLPSGDFVLRPQFFECDRPKVH